MNSQYDAIKQSLRELRLLGGDATISFGGANGVAFWQTSQDIDVLYNTYLDIVNGYGLTRIDLDVEGGAQNKQNNIANAKAIKKLQDETGVEVSLTLPVLPSGLTQTQLDVLEAYLSNNVNLKYINIMAMCYGSGVLQPNENYGTASVRAMDSTKNQIKDYYKKYANTTLSDSEAYAKLGVTVSIGYESGSDPIFIPEWSQLVTIHAKVNNIGMTSYGSSQADPSNTLPIILGVADKQLLIGDSFSPLDGITATDKEDGDLTNKIIVSGSVDTTKAGTYTITYAVTDSKGGSAIAYSKVTVIDTSIPVYDSSKIYLSGDIVMYEGVQYKAKWWTLGETPGASQWGPWEKIS